jgi:alpha-tubulin suppressor-like RCC1 family protein
MKKTILLSIALVLAITISKAQTIAAGWNHSLAVCSDSTAWDWGYNQNFVLGNGTNASSAFPIQVNSLTGIIAIGGGVSYSLALKNDGTVWSWGWNQYGELGNGVPGDTNFIASQVNVLTGIRAISAGGSHCLALKNDSTVWSWGYNVNGELGNGVSTDTNNIPMQISGLTGITAISAGGHHSLALKNDSTVWAWGWNNNGQLGIGTNVDSYVPVQIPGLTGVIAISGNGETNTLALKSDGTVWAWGWNNYGQLGYGTYLDSYIPVQVSSLSGITAIDGGIYYSLALKSDSTVWVWGLNWQGLLGMGTYILDTTIAIQVNGLSGVTAIAAGSSFALAQKNDGTRFAWGDGGYGQLGNGIYTTYPDTVPVRVTALCCVPITTYQSLTVCQGQSIVVGSNTYTTGGTYNDTLTSIISGCDSIIVTQLMVNLLPTVTLNLSSIDTLCESTGIINLTGESPIGGTYSGIGVSENAFDIGTSGLGNHIITYTYTDTNNCSDSATATIYIDVCTGINEINNSIGVTISPNPFSSETTITFNTFQKHTIIKVTDVLGNEIKTINFSGKQCEIEKGEMKNGIYFLQIMDERKSIVKKKIIIQ